MKLKNLIALTSLVGAISPSLCLVGCSETEPKVPEEIESFISDRTFSLMAFSIVQETSTGDYYYRFCYGTCWIIDDATPSITNDYKYHVATNWHVINGFHDLATSTVPLGYVYYDTYYAYADKTSCSNPYQILDSYEDYTLLGGASHGYYVEESDPHTFMYEPYTQNIGIDLYEADINFASSEGKVEKEAIKQKLDRLNAYRSEKHYINKFVCADDPTIQAKTKYTGGYPMKERGDDLFGGKWETHEVNSRLHYVDLHPHNVGSSNVYDYSPQYESNINKGSNWMSGGSSGSMLLTEDCEICGIYWGGWSLGTNFYPSFSLFNTTSKNFLSKYIEN